MFRRSLCFAVLVCLAHAFSAQTVRIIQTTADASSLLAQKQTVFRSDATSVKLRIVIDPAQRFQTIDGFGASLTDSSASILAKLSPAQREEVLRTLFAPEGPLGLTLLRQPIGASDFSAHGDYSYDDPLNQRPDPELKAFSVAPDEATLFPLLREAEHINPQLRVMALPWSAPAWMKTSHSMHAGSLEDRYLEPYARYIARTVESYSKEGVPIFALSLQNEPLNENPSYPTQRMQPEQEFRLAAALQPLLSQAGRAPLLFGYEHNWNDIAYPAKLLSLDAASSQPLFAGISFHCYAGNEAAQSALHTAAPQAGIWFTECSGIYSSSFADSFLWSAQHLLIGALQHDARSLMLWNVVLDGQGDPHNGGCGNCRPLLTVDTHGNAPATIHRTVDFYLLAQLAPFVHPGATRIGAVVSGSQDVEAEAFQNLDGTFAAVTFNASPSAKPVALVLGDRSAAYTLPPRSVATFTWGIAEPVLMDGIYRLASRQGSEALEAVCGSENPAWRPLSASPAQLWALHRLQNGRFEIRNLATAQALAVSPQQLWQTLTLDGAHVAALRLLPQPGGFCVAAAHAGCVVAANPNPLSISAPLGLLAPASADPLAGPVH